VDSLMKKLKFPVQVLHEEIRNQKLKIHQSAVVFLSSTQSHKHYLDNARLVNRYPKEFNFVVYIEGFNERYHEKLKLPTNKLFFPEVFLIRFETERNALKLITLSFFELPHCRADWIVINSFDQSTEKWKSQEFSARYVDKFNGCTIRFDIFEAHKTELNYQFFKNGSVQEIGGYLSFFNQIFAKNLNYSFNFTRGGENFDLKMENVCYDDQKLWNDAKPMSLTFPYTSNSDLVFYQERDTSDPTNELLQVFQYKALALIGGTFILALTVTVVLRLMVKRINRDRIIDLKLEMVKQRSFPKFPLKSNRFDRLPGNVSVKISTVVFVVFLAIAGNFIYSKFYS
jgi:hypothetical protein